jgi:hypothetical protein
MLPSSTPRVHRAAALALAAAGWLILSAASVQARTESLRWQQTDEQNVEGFLVYVGPTAGTYGPAMDVGMATAEGNSVFRHDLTVADDETVYVAVSARAKNGLESGLSNEQMRAGITMPEPQCAADADCSDGDVCTGDERCVGGACAAGTPLSCQAPGMCQQASCDAIQGCLVADLADGTACDDGDGSTPFDSCDAGQCLGSECMNDGDCVDNDVCNGAELCLFGSCVEGSALACPTPDQCQMASCDAVSGCASTDLPNGTVCDDGDPATVTDACMAGMCQGAGDPVASSYRLNAGGPDFTDPSGTLWENDRDYVMGGAPSQKLAPIAGTPVDALYQTDRSGTMSYELPLMPGNYRIRLHFAELDDQVTGAGQRVFDVEAEGVAVLDDFDLFSAAGGGDTAFVHEMNVSVADGGLSLGLFPELGFATIAAIEVDPASAPMPSDAWIPYYLINMGGNRFIDDQGWIWEEDRGFVTRGRRIRKGGSVGADLGPLYSTARKGRSAKNPMTVELPAAPGDYRVRLHFAELKSRYDDVGKRVFDVAAEGNPVMLDYDVVSATGGMGIPAIVELNVTVQDGGLTLQFWPKVDKPILNGVEVLAPPDRDAPSLGPR